MPRRKKKGDLSKLADVVSEAKRIREDRKGGYREQALAMYPHICGRCGRDFAGKDLRDLTVHHIDHNHHNNPPDGSNWELLCVTCHDDEHQNMKDRAYHGGSSEGTHGETPLSHNPFGALGDMLGEDEK